MKQNMDIYRQRKSVWRTLGSRLSKSKMFMAAVLVSMVAGLLPIIVDSPKVAEADMLSVLKAAFNGYSTSQNPGVAPRAANTNTSADAIAAAAAMEGLPYALRARMLSKAAQQAAAESRYAPRLDSKLARLLQNSQVGGTVLGLETLGQ